MSGSSNIPLWLDNGTSITQKVTDRPVDLGSGNITTLGQVSGGTLTDGTASLTAGALSGVTTLAQAGDYTNTLGATDKLYIDATSTVHTGTDGVLNLALRTATAQTPGIYVQTTLTADVDGVSGIQSDITGYSGGGTNGEEYNAFRANINGDGDDTDITYAAYNAARPNANGGGGNFVALMGGLGYDAMIETESGDLVFQDYDVKIYAETETGEGNSISITAADGVGGDSNGGGLTFNLGSPVGEGKVGEFQIIQDNPAGESGVSIASIYNKTAAEGDELLDFYVTDGDDLAFGRWAVEVADVTADHQCGVMWYSLMIDGDDEATALGIESEVDEGDIKVSYTLAGGGTVYMAPEQGEDADAPGLFLIYAADGGEPTSLHDGYKGQVMQVTGGGGSDGFDDEIGGVSAGGDGNNGYFLGGKGGEGINGGANGTDGDTILAFDYEEDAAVGNVGIGTDSPTALLTMGSGRFVETQGADVASANDMTLGEDGNVFEITGTTQINRITSTGWQEGSRVTLVFNESVTVKTGQATGGAEAIIKLAGAGDFSATADDTLTLVYCSTTAGGIAWRECARTAN